MADGAPASLGSQPLMEVEDARALRPGSRAGTSTRPSPLADFDAGASVDSLGGESVPSRGTSIFRPCRPCDLHSHRIPGSQYFALAVWMTLLLAQYCWVRAFCVAYQIPPNCVYHHDVVRVMGDFQYLLSMGFVLAVLTGIHWPDRFLYIFSFRQRSRGPLFLLVFFSAGVGWGALDWVPFLSSLTLTEITPSNAAMLIVIAVSALFLIAFHIFIAYKHNSFAGFASYLLSRGALLTFFAMYLVVKMQHQQVSFHFHHYAVGWLAASLAEFNHPLSTLLLACGTAVFVQGLSAYGADAIIFNRNVEITFLDDALELWISPPISPDAAAFFFKHCVFT